MSQIPSISGRILKALRAWRRWVRTSMRALTVVLVSAATACTAYRAVEGPELPDRVRVVRTDSGTVLLRLPELTDTAVVGRDPSTGVITAVPHDSVARIEESYVRGDVVWPVVGLGVIALWVWLADLTKDTLDPTRGTSKEKPGAADATLASVPETAACSAGLRGESLEVGVVPVAPHRRLLRGWVHRPRHGSPWTSGSMSGTSVAASSITGKRKKIREGRCGR